MNCSVNAEVQISLIGSLSKEAAIKYTEVLSQRYLIFHCIKALEDELEQGFQVLWAWSCHKDIGIAA